MLRASQGRARELNAMSHVETKRENAVAIIVFSNPPVNSFGHAVRIGLLEAIDRAAPDDAVRSIVLTGAGEIFSGGADIREFGTAAARASPTLHEVIAAVESCPKPVIAAINGLCLGGGFELSLGCHYRVARGDAKVGLPEVKLGLLPGAGGTQRLPRLVGLETALNMIVNGEQREASELAHTALFERVVEGNPVAAALDLAARGLVPRRVSALTLGEPNAEALCEFALAAVRARSALPAPQRCIE